MKRLRHRGIIVGFWVCAVLYPHGNARALFSDETDAQQAASRLRLQREAHDAAERLPRRGYVDAEQAVSVKTATAVGADGSRKPIRISTMQLSLPQAVVGTVEGDQPLVPAAGSQVSSFRRLPRQAASVGETVALPQQPGAAAAVSRKRHASRAVILLLFVSGIALTVGWYGRQRERR